MQSSRSRITDDATIDSYQEDAENQGSAQYNQDYTSYYYGKPLQGEAAGAVMFGEGDTFASTVSTLSRVEVSCIDGLNALPLEGHILEIPIWELDNPTDASLDEDGETEHRHLG